MRACWPATCSNGASADRVLIAGLLVAAALVLLWRAFCEFYVAIFRISEDLRALRQTSDADHAVATAVRPMSAPPKSPS